MDRYRYFIFNQRNMVVLGLFQIAFSTVCVVSGFIEGVFRAESLLSKTRAPIWAGMVMGIPGVLALFSSQRKNPVLVNAVIIASIISCVTIVIIIIYSSLTLNYGEEEELSPVPVHAVHTEWLQPSDDQIQAVEMVCAVQSPGNSIFNSPVQFPVQDLDTEEDISKPPPYIRMA
ncbi:uncharacterized protein [Apteryx mantelli]|uniref:Uncharacterized protein isoform X3 n=1 Tax=Apteryx mantelli TaxID=2696672 RepID=A0A8B7J8A8_9AVES|nr:PREDICTED: uncharacterized protein LOC106492106 isoform X3 [Apteryx mantelli mantelli]